MESEPESPELSFLERLISSRNRDLSIFLPILLGLTNSSSNFNEEEEEEDASDNPDPDPSESARPRGRIILINPMTQGMVVIEGTFSRIDSLFRDLLINKQGQPPASKSSIDAMLSVEICEEEEKENGCIICLEDWEVGMKAKEMPCKHKFHGECIEKWLGIHGSCPVCRYKMPVENDDDGGKKLDQEEEDESDEQEESGRERRRRRREIWVNFSFNRDRRNDDSNSDSSLDNRTDSTSSSASVDDMED